MHWALRCENDVQTTLDRQSFQVTVLFQERLQLVDIEVTQHEAIDGDDGHQGLAAKIHGFLSRGQIRAHIATGIGPTLIIEPSLGFLAPPA